jgi:hypothetical protein
MKIEQALTVERRGEAESQMCGDRWRGAGRATAEARGRGGSTERRGRMDRGPAETHMNVVAESGDAWVTALQGICSCFFGADLFPFSFSVPLSIVPQLTDIAAWNPRFPAPSFGFPIVFLPVCPFCPSPLDSPPAHPTRVCSLCFP